MIGVIRQETVRQSRLFVQHTSYTENISLRHIRIDHRGLQVGVAE